MVRIVPNHMDHSSGTWVEKEFGDNTVDDVWIPAGSPPGIYLGRIEVGAGITDSRVLIGGQVYVVRDSFIEPVQCKPPMGMV